ncbi:protein PHLOEM UNLOADING MODULATOR-like [Miscanthus floridulus]|uniref:protein PHLOEM UNLOADING MODULATOR-like n=1 Tax=Miscanthus floridulus TaxID=154761 RepID=UPI0034599C36
MAKPKPKPKRPAPPRRGAGGLWRPVALGGLPLAAAAYVGVDYLRHLSPVWHGRLRPALWAALALATAARAPFYRRWDAEVRAAPRFFAAIAFMLAALLCEAISVRFLSTVLGLQWHRIVDDAQCEEAYGGWSSVLIWFLVIHSAQREVRERHHYSVDCIVAIYIGILLWRMTGFLWSAMETNRSRRLSKLDEVQKRLFRAAKDSDVFEIRNLTSFHSAFSSPLLQL